MTGRAIIVLAVLATACLALGARLLDAPTKPTLVVAVLCLLVGTGLAAMAVAGAWRPVSRASETSADNH
jgi:Zn-dependent protease with chaperone function